MKTVFDLSRDEIVSLTCKDIYLYIDKELAGKGIPIEAKNWNIKNEKEVVYPRTGVPVFMLKDIGIGFRTIEGATEVANLLIKYGDYIQLYTTNIPNCFYLSILIYIFVP